MDDDRRLDPTIRLLEDFVRQVSEDVVVPAFTGDVDSARHLFRHMRKGGPVLALVLTTMVAAGAIALTVAYGPRSAPVGPRPEPATQPTPQSTTTTTSTSTTTVASGTRQITYEPFTAAGIDPSLRVTSQVTGTCIRYGRGAPARSYFRCFGADNGVYDPCFAGPHATTAPLVCPTSPTSNDVVAFTVTSVTSDEPPSPSQIPWAIQLSGGQVCLLVSAAWSGLGPYGCGPAVTGQSVADCHAPVSSQPSWTAACQEQETATSPFTSKVVVAVWF